MSFYQFTEDQLRYATNTQIFKEFHKYLCDKIMVLDSDFFKGDMKIYEECKQISGKCASPSQVSGNYEILKDYSLAYLSPCVYQDHLTDDIVTRNMVLSKITSKYCVEYWAFLHQCQDLATFVIYPICKILWPNDEFYLYHGISHTVILNQSMVNFLNTIKDLNNENIKITTTNNDGPCIFDFISMSIGESSKWIFKDFCYDSGNLIHGKNISAWYPKTYGYYEFDAHGINHIFTELHK